MSAEENFLLNKRGMKRLVFVSILVICNSIGKAEHRFFPANSIRCLNAMIFNYAEDEEGNMIKISPDTVYLEMWTGNDTIVDGKECVALWKEIGRDMSEYGYYVDVKPNVPLYDGVVYEAENGYVYFKSRHNNSDWTILYDFSDSDWEIGDSLYIFDDEFDGPFFEVIRNLSTNILCNGEEVPVANGLMYGIGYDYRPFFTPMYEVNAYSPEEIPVEFYRDSVLLYQRFKRGNPHSGIDTTSQTYSYDYYDLQGRKVAHPTRGIYIKDGRKVILK